MTRALPVSGRIVFNSSSSYHNEFWKLIILSMNKLRRQKRLVTLPVSPRGCLCGGRREFTYGSTVLCSAERAVAAAQRCCF